MAFGLRVAVIALAAGAGCRPSVPAAPPAAPAAVTAPANDDPGAATARERRGYTAADVRFMQHMIAHHAQALAMTSLVPARTTRDDMRLLAERIAVSQRDEIAAMQRWLRNRGEEVPGAEGAHQHHGSSARSTAMPGMLTADELARLAGAKGPEFEQLFLQLMIRHHEGALAMVGALFATPGAAQESELFRFASDVDADQRAEIARMRALQAAPGGGARR